MSCSGRIWRIRLLLGVLLVLALLRNQLVAQQHRVIYVRVHSVALEGNLLGDSADREVMIYLPPAYEQMFAKRFPVVYLLHGYTATDRMWAGNEYVQGLDIANMAETLIKRNKIKEMILVAPDCKNAYGGSWYTNSAVTGNWEDFVTKELVDYIDQNYRTLAQQESRGIAGHSMGGHGALKLAMKHPNTFSAVYAMSPACIVFSEAILNRGRTRMSELSGRDELRFESLNWQDQVVIALAAAQAPNPHNPPLLGDFPVDDAGYLHDTVWRRWLEQDPFSMIETHRANLLRLTAIRIDCGITDNVLTESQLFSKALTDAGIKHIFEHYRGDHVNRVADRVKQSVLPFFSQTLKVDVDAIAVGSR